MARLHSWLAVSAVVAITLATAVSGYKAVEAGRDLRLLESELATLKAARYGVLDPDSWIIALSKALSDRIADFELSVEDRARLQEAISALLLRFIEEMEATVREAPSILDELLAGPRPAMRLIRRYLADWEAFQRDLEESVEAIGAGLVLDRAKMRENVQAYAQSVLDRAGEKDVRDEVSLLVRDWLDRWSKEHFARTDRAALDAVLLRHECATRSACIASLKDTAASRRDMAQRSGWTAVAGLSLLLAGAAVGGRVMPLHRSRWILLTSIGGLAVMLVAGAVSPMMTIQAEISAFTITILDQPISFDSQLLYHRSESIVDLGRLLLAASQGTSVLVGVMVLLFSIILPSVKLTATAALVLGASSRWISFLASKTAKWAMADVFVVAILMATLGMDGVMVDAAGGVGGVESAIQLSSAEGTTLEVGFYLFLAFAIGSIVLTEIVESVRGRSRVVGSSIAG